MKSFFLGVKAKKPLTKTRASVEDSFPQLMKLADEVFSKWVRKQATNAAGILFCYTCDDKERPQEADLSHFIRRRNMATRYSEIGCKACCQHCNRDLEGNLIVYRERLVAEYGEEAVLELEALGRSEVKLSRFELLEIITKYS